MDASRTRPRSEPRRCPGERPERRATARLPHTTIPAHDRTRRPRRARLRAARDAAPRRARRCGLAHGAVGRAPPSMPSGHFTGHSFPSGHVMNTALAAIAIVVLAAAFRHRRRWWAVAV